MKLRATLTGTGQPLLLIHGLGSAATAWKPLLKDLQAHYRVITVDLPGHGQTPLEHGIALDPHSLAQLVLQVLDENQIDKAHIVGNSLGGWVALELAATAPERVLSVVGLAPAGLWLKPGISRVRGEARARAMARTLHKSAPKLLKYKFARQIGFSTVSPRWDALDVETCVDATVAMGTSRGYFPTWDAFLGKRFDEEISPNIPVTIIFGDTDNTLPVHTSQERSLAPQHAKWIVIPQCGHAPMWDHPKTVLSYIEETCRA